MKYLNLSKFFSACAIVFMSISNYAAPLPANNDNTHYFAAINNAGFENNTMPDGLPIPDNTFRVDPGTPSDWTHYDPHGLLNGTDRSIGLINPTGSTFFPSGALEGNLAALVYIDNVLAQGEVGIEQTLLETLELDTEYRLAVGIGNIASGTGSPSSADGGASFFDLTGFPGYRIELLAGNTVIGHSSGVIPAEGEWLIDRVHVVPVVDTHPELGQNLTIRLLNLNATTGIEVDFDNVQLLVMQENIQPNI